MNKNKIETKSFAQQYLTNFLKYNPHAEVSVDDYNIFIDNPWMRKDVFLKFSTDDADFISIINNIKFSSRFDAIFHMDTNTAEFIYSYLDPRILSNKDILDRKFTIEHKGDKYKCYFKEPSKRLFKIAARFEKKDPSVRLKSVPQIIPFKDAQELEKKSDKIQEYFKNKVARSFFVQSEQRIDLDEFEKLTRQINLLAYYHDRKTPIITIKSDVQAAAIEHKSSVRYVRDFFPEKLVSQPVDEIPLKLIEVARESKPRFAFLYYYQIIEYAGYAYREKAAKQQLTDYLQHPVNTESGTQSDTAFFATLSEFSRSHDIVIKKVLKDCCDPAVLWKEIEYDLDFFTTQQRYDGGLTIKPLISEDTTPKAWETMWMPALYDQLTDIQNAIISVRDWKQNSMLLPTPTNTVMLARYIPLIRRMAEQLVLGPSNV
ncbi:MAG: hypothetical protein CSA33_03450 [Desulfobulbus propionicus]|nr:MAG: hypothetical protein CSA33_03450 [Desulfobulbus propionicus]